MVERGGLENRCAPSGAPWVRIPPSPLARLAEMVDALHSGCSARKGVQVRVLRRAQRGGVATSSAVFVFWILPLVMTFRHALVFGTVVGCFAIQQLVVASVPDSVGTEVKGAKSPTGALLRSLFVPGWGQLYVGAYWKAPVFFLGSLVSGYLTLSNQRQYVSYQRQLEQAVERGDLPQRIALLRAYRTLYVERRDLALAFWVAAYVLAAVDAYVEAHLSGFNVSEQLSVAPLPLPSQGVVLSVRWQW